MGVFRSTKGFVGGALRGGILEVYLGSMLLVVPFSPLGVFLPRSPLDSLCWLLRVCFLLLINALYFGECFGGWGLFFSGFISWYLPTPVTRVLLSSFIFLPWLSFL